MDTLEKTMTITLIVLSVTMLLFCALMSVEIYKKIDRPCAEETKRSEMVWPFE